MFSIIRAPLDFFFWHYWAIFRTFSRSILCLLEKLGSNFKPILSYCAITMYYFDLSERLNFDHDLGYSFPLFSSLLKKGGRRKGEWISKIVIKIHAFQNRSIIWHKVSKVLVQYKKICLNFASSFYYISVYCSLNL